MLHIPGYVYAEVMVLQLCGMYELGAGFCWYLVKKARNFSGRGLDELAAERCSLLDRCTRR